MTPEEIREARRHALEIPLYLVVDPVDALYTDFEHDACSKSLLVIDPDTSRSIQALILQAIHSGACIATDDAAAFSVWTFMGIGADLMASVLPVVDGLTHQKLQFWDHPEDDPHFGYNDRLSATDWRAHTIDQ